MGKSNQGRIRKALNAVKRTRNLPHTGKRSEVKAFVRKVRAG